MSYADKQTDKALNGLIGQITTVYNDALSEVSKTASDYFASYRERFEKEKKAYEDGKYTKEQFYNWQVAQIGRGERWLKVRDDIAQRLTDANKVAAAYVNDTTPGIYTLNANYSAYEIEQETGIAFDIYDEQTVKGLLTGKTKIIPQSKVKESDSNAWNTQKLTNALTSAILQGKDINQIADAFQRVAEMNRTSAIRNARTSITTAENSGRQASYEQAHELGIEIKKEWIATEDDRTRDSHAELDGVQVPYDKPYPNGLMYPGDQNGEPSEFYNCRCTERAIIPKYNGQQRTSEIDGHKGDHTEETYKEWLDRKREEKMQNSKPTTHADATARAMEAKEDKEAEPNNIIEFTPAKTKAEAEEYAKQFADNVNYKGISLENCNKINQTLTELTSKYPINTINDLSAMNGKAAGKANWNHLNLNGKQMGDNGMADYLSMRRSTEESLELLLDRWGDKKNIPFAIESNITKLENVLKYDRWGVCNSYDDPVKVIVSHEYGHILADQYFGQLNHELANANYSTYAYNQLYLLNKDWESAFAKARETGDIYSLSQYGSKNAREFFSESFAAREMGETLPDYVEELMERTLSNGIL